MVVEGIRRRLTIGVVGAGGDGVVALGSFLQRLAASQGYFSQMPRFYGAQIRGGGSAVKLGLDAESISMPQDTLDILLCFSWERYLEFRQELDVRPDTLVICENGTAKGITLPQKTFQIGFSGISRDVTGSPRNKNIVALGLLARIVAFPRNRLRKAIDEDEELHLLKENMKAIEAGESLFLQMSFPELRLSQAYDDSAKLIIHGNAAMARGAIRAECQAFFGYPITPAAEIMQEMQKELSGGKGTFLQAEDEIAAAGLVVGSSLTGTKSMTSTSGPGLDLMTEMMGLASAAEIPMVIIDVQRCGPSTGIPSKSEQSDLNHAIYGGHGDAPRVVIAPYDIEGCYRLTIESFNIAHQFQTPVIVLSDQWLGQTFVAVNEVLFDTKLPVSGIKRPEAKDLGDYHRYRLTEDFISPLAAVGEEGLVYQTTGLSHTENGSPTFDSMNHQKLHEKRWGKLALLCHRDELVKLFGREECASGIVTWGSSAQAVLETIKDVGLQDEVRVCVPELIHPLPARVERFLESLDRLLVIEMNYSGQMYHYLGSQIDLPEKTEVYCRAGGTPFSTKELTEPIAKMVR